MDHDLLLDLLEQDPQIVLFRVVPLTALRISQARLEDQFEYLAITTHIGKVAAVLGESKHVVDVRDKAIFEQDGPPAYFDRCRELRVDRVASHVELRERGSRRSVDFVGRQEAEVRRVRALARLFGLVVSPRIDVVVGFDTAVIAAAPGARVAVAETPEEVVVSDRLDFALVDASLPDWGALKVVDWFQGTLPMETIGLVAEAPENPIWARVRSRGVLRVADLSRDLQPVLEAGKRRNVGRWKTSKP